MDPTNQRSLADMPFLVLINLFSNFTDSELVNIRGVCKTFKLFVIRALNKRHPSGIVQFSKTSNAIYVYYPSTDSFEVFDLPINYQ